MQDTKIGLPKTFLQLMAAAAVGIGLSSISNPWGWYAWWVFLFVVDEFSSLSPEVN